jgi:hypothetical protein
MKRRVNAHQLGGSIMKRLITGFGLTLALLTIPGALDPARAAGLTLPTKGQQPPGPSGYTPVWRVQLYTRVCDYADARTDNKVLAALNDANSTVMDSPVNDFERADERTYDLLLTGVTTLSDIKYLKIFKGGSDGVCLSQLSLYVNERLIYDRTLSAAQQWLDDEYYSYDSRTLFIPGTTLRGHTAWQGWTAGFRPLTVSAAEIRSRLATAVGTGMYDFNIVSIHSLSWGSDMSLERLDTTGLEVAVWVDYKCIDPTFGDGGCGDSYVLYWAHLRLSCSGGAIMATKENDGGHVQNGVNSAADELDAVRQWVGPRLPQAFLNIKFGVCPTISVLTVGSADVRVELW